MAKFILFYLLVTIFVGLLSAEPLDQINNTTISSSSSTTTTTNNNNSSATNEEPDGLDSRWVWSLAQQPLDEFNNTESPQVLAKIISGGEQWQKQTPLSSLKQVLMRYNYDVCCPSWQNLSINQGILEQLRKRHATSKNVKVSLHESEVLNELKRTFHNITYLSIDGQYGDNEREKYYNFYDAVNYYLRLIKVAHSRLMDPEIANDDGDANRVATEDSIGRKDLRRFLRTIEFRAHLDPVLSSFLKELLLDSPETQITKDTPIRWNPNFEFYEDFIRLTKFGQDYARNISLVQESILAFDQICSHLTSFNFPNNYTRPSKQYEMVRRMSYELYLIRDELIQQVSVRVRHNREDLKRIFAKLEDIVESRPYIRLLGDEFSSNPPYFSSYVRQLTHLLDLYLSNSMTQVSFYDQLAELPQEFIILGSSIAHNYENKEVPQFSQFDTDYFSWPSPNRNKSGKDRPVKPSNISTKTTELADPRQSNLSLLTRLFI